MPAPQEKRPRARSPESSQLGAFRWRTHQGTNQTTAAPPAAAEECANTAHRDSRDHPRPAERLRGTACPARYGCNRDDTRSSLKMVKGHQQTETPALTFRGSGKLLSKFFKSKRQRWVYLARATTSRPQILHLPLPDIPRAERIRVLGMSQDLQGKRFVRSRLHRKRFSHFETSSAIRKITVLYNTKCLHSVLRHFTPSGIIIIIKNTQLSRKDRNTTKESRE